MIQNLCKGQKVLDVGCIGQDFTTTDTNWLHNQIRSVASDVTGVDIATDKIKELNAQGYKMLHVTQLQNLDDRYDVIIMADVIEHVDDPVGFLRFYSQFLKEHGSMMVSTPNANRAINFFSILLFNNYSVNDEHTCWFCPKTINEVVGRSGLQIRDFFWLKRYYSLKGLSFVTILLSCFSDCLAFLRRNFHQNFMVILSK
jgi:2-polyprenyl-3-methyl-5-hydroxy-6-metoxy-1,4-benzoquinol methylase